MNLALRLRKQHFTIKIISIKYFVSLAILSLLLNCSGDGGSGSGENNNSKNENEPGEEFTNTGNLEGAWILKIITTWYSNEVFDIEYNQLFSRYFYEDNGDFISRCRDEGEDGENIVGTVNNGVYMFNSDASDDVVVLNDNEIEIEYETVYEDTSQRKVTVGEFIKVSDSTDYIFGIADVSHTISDHYTHLSFSGNDYPIECFYYSYVTSQAKDSGDVGIGLDTPEGLLRLHFNSESLGYASLWVPNSDEIYNVDWNADVNNSVDYQESSKSITATLNVDSADFDHSESDDIGIIDLSVLVDIAY